MQRHRGKCPACRDVAGFGILVTKIGPEESSPGPVAHAKIEILRFQNRAGGQAPARLLTSQTGSSCRAAWRLRTRHVRGGIVAMACWLNMSIHCRRRARRILNSARNSSPTSRGSPAGLECSESDGALFADLCSKVKTFSSSSSVFVSIRPPRYVCYRRIPRFPTFNAKYCAL